VAGRVVDLSQVQPRDVVLVSQRGRVFHATVQGAEVGGLVVAPHDPTVRARSVRPGEIIDHWVHADRAEPMTAAQLAIDGLELA